MHWEYQNIGPNKKGIYISVASEVPDIEELGDFTKVEPGQESREIRSVWGLGFTEEEARRDAEEQVRKLADK